VFFSPSFFLPPFKP
jgi:hypothetical protein